jgi:hypothetical protein
MVGKDIYQSQEKLWIKSAVKLNIISMSKGIDRNAGKEVFHLLDRKEFTLDKKSTNNEISPNSTG